MENKTIIIASVEQTTTKNGSIRFRIKSVDNLTFGLWKMKKDGTKTRAYQYLESLGLEAVGKCVSIAYKEDPGEYEGKPIVYRTIIGMEKGMEGQDSPQNPPQGNTASLEARVADLAARVKKLEGDAWKQNIPASIQEGQDVVPPPEFTHPTDLAADAAHASTLSPAEEAVQEFNIDDIPF